MIDFIYSNYNIYIDKLYSKKDSLFFFVNDIKVYIIKIEENNLKHIEKLISITNELYSIINVNTFIINKYGRYYTKYDEEYIFLLRVNNLENDFDINDIYKFWNINTQLEDFNILDEWKSEVDWLEEKLIEYNKEFQLIQRSVNYYIGMAENAIQFLNDYKTVIIRNNDSIGHKLSYKLFKDKSLFDPFTFIKTNKMYDISNYIKYKLLNNKLDYNEVELFFSSGNEYENVFLFSCLLYPNVYFDLVKNILLEHEEENKLELLIKNRKNYIKLLSFCKKMVKNNKNIKLINWFK